MMNDPEQPCDVCGLGAGCGVHDLAACDHYLCKNPDAPRPSPWIGCHAFVLAPGDVFDAAVVQMFRAGTSPEALLDLYTAEVRRLRAEVTFLRDALASQV